MCCRIWPAYLWRDPIWHECKLGYSLHVSTSHTMQYSKVYTIVARTFIQWILIMKNLHFTILKPLQLELFTHLFILLIRLGLIIFQLKIQKRSIQAPPARASERPALSSSSGGYGEMSDKHKTLRIIMK